MWAVREAFLLHAEEALAKAKQSKRAKASMWFRDPSKALVEEVARPQEGATSASVSGPSEVERGPAKRDVFIVSDDDDEEETVANFVRDFRSETKTPPPKHRDHQNLDTEMRSEEEHLPEDEDEDLPPTQERKDLHPVEQMAATAADPPQEQQPLAGMEVVAAVNPVRAVDKGVEEFALTATIKHFPKCSLHDCYNIKVDNKSLVEHIIKGKNNLPRPNSRLSSLFWADTQARYGAACCAFRKMQLRDREAVASPRLKKCMVSMSDPNNATRGLRPTEEYFLTCIDYNQKEFFGLSKLFKERDVCKNERFRQTLRCSWTPLLVLLKIMRFLARKCTILTCKPRIPCVFENCAQKRAKNLTGVLEKFNRYFLKHQQPVF